MSRGVYVSNSDAIRRMLTGDHFSDQGIWG
jgi:hypothetical protein